MKIKQLVCLTLCVLLVIGTTACNDVEDAFSSSNTSTLTSATTSTEEYNDVEITEEENDANTSSQSKPTTTSDNNASSSPSNNLDASENSDSENSDSENSDSENSDSENSGVDAVEMLYGFKSIESVDFYCAKNLPGSDTVYSVSTIITNKDTDIVGNPGVKILCDDKNVKIDGMFITIPASYTQSNKAVKLTAYHSGVGSKCDFTIKPAAKWDLTFEDNFDGKELDTSVWNVWDFNDWSYFYSPDAIYLDGEGNLINEISILETKHPEYGFDRQCGAITTLDKFEQTYGYYEIRMIPNLTSGLWSAFWLVGGDMSDVDAVDDDSAVNGFEVDIVETYYCWKYPAQTIHWDGYYNEQTKTKNFSFHGMEEIFDGDYHTFGFRWSPEEYTFFIDGKPTAKIKSMGICIEPAYLLVSAHFGNAGEMILKPGEKDLMIVDYVKVYSSNEDIK